MTLDKPTLQKELAALVAEKEQAFANANAILGAIKIVEQLIAKLDQPEESKEP